MFKLVAGKLIYEIDAPIQLECGCNSEQLKLEIINSIYKTPYYNSAECHTIFNHSTVNYSMNCPNCGIDLVCNRFDPLGEYICICHTKIKKVFAYLFVWEN